MSGGQRREISVLPCGIVGDGIEVKAVRFGFIHVVGDGSVIILSADPRSASEGRGAIHASDEVSGNGLSGFVMAREFREHLGTADPFFQHLGRRFGEIRFHGNAADTGPRLLSAEDVVHKVAELVEESFHVIIGHQTGIACRWGREVADQNCLGQLLIANAIENRHHLGVSEFPRPGMHVEIETPNGIAFVQNHPGLDGGIP